MRQKGDPKCQSGCGGKASPGRGTLATKSAGTLIIQFDNLTNIKSASKIAGCYRFC